MREQLDRLISEMVDKGIFFADARREFERRYIQYALSRAKGSLTGAAELLGMHRNSLSRKLTEYRIRRPES